MAVAGPALIAGNFEQVEGVEAVIAELDFGDRPAAGVGDTHGRADDAALIKRRVPRRFQSLRGSEYTAERGSDVFTKDVRHTQMRFTVVQGQADGLNESCHRE